MAGRMYISIFKPAVDGITVVSEQISIIIVADVD